MIICLINGIIMAVKFLFHSLCFCCYAILLFTRQIQFNHRGEALGILSFLFNKDKTYNKAKDSESDTDEKHHNLEPKYSKGTKSN